MAFARSHTAASTCADHAAYVRHRTHLTMVIVKAMMVGITLNPNPALQNAILNTVYIYIYFKLRGWGTNPKCFKHHSHNFSPALPLPPPGFLSVTFSPSFCLRYLLQKCSGTTKSGAVALLPERLLPVFWRNGAIRARKKNANKKTCLGQIGLRAQGQGRKVNLNAHGLKN